MVEAPSYDNMKDETLMDVQTLNGVLIDSGNPEDSNPGWEVIRNQEDYLEFVEGLESGDLTSDMVIDWDNQMLFIAYTWLINEVYPYIERVWEEDGKLNIEVKNPDESFYSTVEQRKQIAYAATVIPNGISDPTVIMAFRPW